MKAGTSDIAATAKDQTAMLLADFEREAESVQQEFLNVFELDETNLPDGPRGMLYMRRDVMELIEAGKALASGAPMATEAAMNQDCARLYGEKPVWEIQSGMLHIDHEWKRYLKLKSDDGLAMLDCLGNCLLHHPAFKTELGAIRAICDGGNVLNELSCGKAEHPGPLTGAEEWLKRQLRDEPTIERMFEAIRQAEPMLKDSPQSKGLIETIEKMFEARHVFEKLRGYLESL
jgi:hypothetical protein